MWEESKSKAFQHGMCFDEHWVLYLTYESLNTTSKANDALYSG